MSLLEFHEACKRGDLDKVTNLLSRKEEIDVKQLDIKSTLQYAAKNGHLEIVELLLRIGVNVNQKDSTIFGIRPLHCACASGNVKIAKMLLDNGADIDPIIKFLDKTALHFAVSNKKTSTSIVKLLLENGCKTMFRNHEDLTALETALDKGYVGIVKLFAFHNK